MMIDVPAKDNFDMLNKPDNTYETKAPMIVPLAPIVIVFNFFVR